MKKVAFIIYSLEMGGAERVISELANKFSEKKSKIFIILFSQKKPYFDLNSNITLIHLPVLSDTSSIFIKINNTFKRFYFLRKVILENDITNIISFTTTINIYSLIVSFLTPAKIIISERTDPLAHKIDSILVVLRKLFYRFADKVVIQNKVQYDFYSKYVNSEKLLIIPNPVKKIVGNIYLNKEVNIISVGRLIKSKNHIELIMCFKDAEINCKLIIIGDGDQKETIVDFLKKNDLQNRVELLGSQKDVYKHLNPNCIFASTSLYEGFPNALIEAMNAGLNCIHYDCPSGINEIIEDDVNGYLIPLNSKEIFTQKLKEVYQNSEKRIVISENAKIRAKDYDAEKISKKWEQIL
jgi:GalNAc-alpha-(1->4)-GalNAc-alpha-(1->3)-diNAcBac-PP-undecaprenol alpha-1,4-N-acetyl-D-galactosaminyltransferase